MLLNYISFQIKKLLTKSLALTIKIIDLGFRGISRFFRLLKSPFLLVKNIIFKLAVLPLFGQYLKVKNKFAQKTPNTGEKIILIFTNRYVIHLIIFVMAFVVAVSNISAYEDREDYGRGALIYEIIGLEELEIIEDTVVTSEEPQVSKYLEESSQLESELFTEAQKVGEQIYQEQHESDLATTQGGSALTKPDLASTEAAKITRTSVREHIVEEGESIGSIANQYSISVNTILWANNLSFYSLIKPEQKLNIPPTSGIIHQVKRGDTLLAIAKKYGSDATKIKEFNNIDDDDTLPVGETIMVPGGRIIYTPRPRSYTTPDYNTPAYSTPSVSSGGKMYWPSTCHRITQYYRGWRHTGVDIGCGWNKPIRAAEAGTVSRVQYARYGYGYNVTINHGGGKQTLYAHLGKIYVKVGQKVDKAQVIATEGSTGRSTGPHLHFEVIINGSKLNPLNYVR